jgi:hypothetical protein
VGSIDATSVLRVSNPLQLAKGRAFTLLVDPERAGARYDGITADGRPSQTPRSNTACTIVSSPTVVAAGQRFGSRTPASAIDKEARPRLAQGAWRVIDDRREKHEPLLYLGSHDELTGSSTARGSPENLPIFCPMPGAPPPKVRSCSPASMISR